MDLKTVQRQLKANISKHQMLMGRLKSNPDDPSIRLSLREVQKHIAELGSLQKNLGKSRIPVDSGTTTQNELVNGIDIKQPKTTAATNSSPKFLKLEPNGSNRTSNSSLIISSLSPSTFSTPSFTLKSSIPSTGIAFLCSSFNSEAVCGKFAKTDLHNATQPLNLSSKTKIEVGVQHQHAKTAGNTVVGQAMEFSKMAEKQSEPDAFSQNLLLQSPMQIRFRVPISSADNVPFRVVPPSTLFKPITPPSVLRLPSCQPSRQNVPPNSQPQGQRSYSLENYRLQMQTSIPIKSYLALQEQRHLAVQALLSTRLPEGVSDQIRSELFKSSELLELKLLALTPQVHQIYAEPPQIESVQDLPVKLEFVRCDISECIQGLIRSSSDIEAIEQSSLPDLPLSDSSRTSRNAVLKQEKFHVSKSMRSYVIASETSNEKIIFLGHVDLIPRERAEKMRNRRYGRRRAVAHPVYSGGVYVSTTAADSIKRALPNHLLNIGLDILPPKRPRGRPKGSISKRSFSPVEVANGANEEYFRILQETEPSPVSMPQQDKVEDLCEVCKRPGEFLMCDTCSHLYHMSCLKPPLRSVPTGMWCCSDCKKKIDAPASAIEWPGLLSVVQSFVAFNSQREVALARARDKTRLLKTRNNKLNEQKKLLTGVLKEKVCLKSRQMDLHQQTMKTCENITTLLEKIRCAINITLDTA